MPVAECRELLCELRSGGYRAGLVAARCWQGLLLALLCLPSLLMAASRPTDQAVLRDVAGVESIATVSASAAREHFVPLQGALNAGFTRDVHWLRFSVPPSAGELWLEIQAPFLDDLRLYEEIAGSFHERRAGDHLPFAAREVPYRAFVFKLAAGEARTHSTYLRLQTNSTSLLSLKLWQPDEFLAAANHEYALFGLSYGVLLIVLLFNAVLWVWLRDPLYGWFCLCIFFNAMVNIGVNGYASEYLFPDIPRIADAWVGIVLFLAISTAVPFYRRMLRVDARMPVLFAAFRITLVVPLLLVPVSLAGYHPEAGRVAMSLFLVMTFVGLWRSWRIWREGCHEGLLLLIANALPMLGSMVAVLTALGLYAGDMLALNARQFTAIGSIVAFHFALAIRIRTMRAELNEAEKLQTIMDFVPSGVTFFDAEMKMLTCNEQFKRLLDFPESMFQGRLPSLTELVSFNAARGDYGPGDATTQVKEVMERARALRPHIFERTRPNGTVLEIRGTPLHSGHGFVTLYTDITERKRNEQLVRHVKDLMSDAINFSPTYIWETDSEGRYSFLQGVDKLLGYNADQLLGAYRWACFGLSAETAASLQETMRAQAAFDQKVICANKHSGELVWLSSSAQAVFDEYGRFAGYRGVDVDVSELTRARQELEQMALHDALTGLANRRKFQLRYELEVVRQQRSGQALVLMIIDVDHFKAVNDSYGHIVGDACLKTIANTLASNARSIDLLARFGGEEFLLLLADSTLDEGLEVAEKLRRAMEQTEVHAIGLDQPLRVSISIGVAERVATSELSLDALIERADAGVYRAKDAGRNRVCRGD